MRPDGETANDEQWQTLRAIAINALLAQHRANMTRVAGGHRALSAQEAAESAYDECRAELQKIVTLSSRVAKQRVQFNLARPHRVTEAKSSRPVEAWHGAWVSTGLANEATVTQLILPPRQQPAQGQPPATPLPKAVNAPTPLPANTLVIYTDGSGPDRHAAHQTAGWGFTVVTGGDGNADARAIEQHSRCGYVATDANDAQHIGAERATNNTAELTAIARALEYVAQDQSGRPVLIRYDSLYAGNMATGKWRARKNMRLVDRVRSLWAKVHDHVGGHLWATHVYGHTDHKWNDRADELAQRGKGGAPPPTQDGGAGQLGLHSWPGRRHRPCDG